LDDRRSPHIRPDGDARRSIADYGPKRKAVALGPVSAADEHEAPGLTETGGSGDN